MVTSLSPTGVDLTRDEYLEFWLFQPGGTPADSAGVRLVFDLGTRERGRAGDRARQLHGQRERYGLHRPAVRRPGRLDTERTDIGIFNAQVDDIGILGDRPDQITEAERRDRWASSPLCERVLSNAGSDLSLGRPQQPLHQGQRRARYRGPERRQRSSTPPGPTTTSFATS